MAADVAMDKQTATNPRAATAPLVSAKARNLSKQKRIILKAGGTVKKTVKSPEFSNCKRRAFMARRFLFYNDSIGASKPNVFNTIRKIPNTPNIMASPTIPQII